ncbi:MAG TPA: isoprenylcysteine carboxylmethyltransferase family protein [Pyrinomonadaceae bacterium]|jgi:protein-S-isoprenylcysteine O-methyltransferase Ste14
MKQTNTAASFPLSRLLLSFIYLLFFPLLVFLVAGDWRWIEGWIFSAVFFLGSCGTLLYLYFADPELLNERYASPVQKEQKSWDKVLLSLFFLEFLIWFAIMPLDAKRFGWTPLFPFWIRVIGAVLLVIAFYLLYAALRENTFAAPVVKMQKERGQEVVSTGPYAIVRHPMYTGAVLLFISAPLLLSSYAGLAFGLALIVTIAVRSLGEEAMLKEELAGYREYMRRVKWRMIPFVF